MMKWFVLRYAALFVVFVLLVSTMPPSSSLGQENGLKVVATLPSLGTIAQEVLGDRGQVFVLVPFDSDPHQYAPSPADVQLVEESDLFLCVGKEEFLGQLPERAGKVRLSWENWTNAGVYVKNENPHYIWLYPRNAKVVASVIASALSYIDPEGATLYAQRASDFARRVDELMEWASTFIEENGVSDRKVVLVGSHFVPLMEALNITVVDVLIKGAGKQPSPADVSRVEENIRKEGVSVVVALSSQRGGLEGDYAELLARDTGASVLYLYSFPRSEKETYVEFMKYDIALLVGALQASGAGRAASNDLKALSISLAASAAVVFAVEVIVLWRRR